MTVPGILDVHIPNDALGVVIVSIDKTRPGQAMAAGQVISGMLSIAKVLIFVDKDVPIRNQRQVIAALGARWQPSPASLIIPQTQSHQLDPSGAASWSPPRSSSMRPGNCPGKAGRHSGRR